MALILIVETGNVTPGANSYASLAEANAYHEASLYAAPWDAADDATKTKALVNATRVIDAEFSFAGYRVSTDQNLEWPRYQVPRPGATGWSSNPLQRNIGGEDSWPSNAVPLRLKAATAELAKVLMASDRTADDATKGIKSLGLGQGAVDIEFEASDRKQPLPDHVLALLDVFGQDKRGGGVMPVRRT